MSKIVVTGSAGFIGSHLAECLARNGYEVYLIDNLDSYYSVDLKKHNLDHVLKYRNAHFIKGDICDLDFLKTVIDKETEFVFHEAAQPGVRFSIENPLKTNNVNISGTLNVLKASLDADVSRVINASSSSVYGEVKHLPFDEMQPNNPISPYGISKLATEWYCKNFYENYGLPTVSLRYFTVYGERMRPDLAVYMFTREMLSNDPIVIFGDGTQTRDFTYIGDVIAANMRLLDTSNADGKIMNIGNGRRISINDLVNRLEDIIGNSSEIRYAENQKGDLKHTLAGIGLANKLIGYLPSVSIEEGLSRFVEWYKTGEVQIWAH